jgi:SAM-dependent methyltransferase
MPLKDQPTHPQTHTTTPMNHPATTCRLYSDLAWLWSMWGSHTAEYARYCDHAVRLIRQYSQRPVASLLDISCGGGKNIFNLKRHFQVTGVDLSPTMLDLAATLNPECDFVQGDMRDFSLDKRFDAILMDDGVSYMTSRADLAAALQNAFRHLEAGGVMVVTPDVTTENFCQNRTTCTPASEDTKPDGIDVIFVENTYDPDPTDEHYETTMVFLIREQGKLRVETDLHILGLFSLDTWRQLLRDAGFVIQEKGFSEDEDNYLTFACVKPK